MPGGNTAAVFEQASRGMDKACQDQIFFLGLRLSWPADLFSAPSENKTLWHRNKHGGKPTRLSFQVLGLSLPWLEFWTQSTSLASEWIFWKVICGLKPLTSNGSQKQKTPWAVLATFCFLPQFKTAPGPSFVLFHRFCKKARAISISVRQKTRAAEFCFSTRRERPKLPPVSFAHFLRIREETSFSSVSQFRDGLTFPPLGRKAPRFDSLPKTSALLLSFIFDISLHFPALIVVGVSIISLLLCLWLLDSF